MLSFRKISPVAGVEVTGIDLHDPIAPDTAHALRAAWLEHSLLLFRDQPDLTEAQQRRAQEIFGEISSVGHNTENGLSYVSNVAEKLGHNPSGAMGFHLDHSFYPQPLRGLMLYALETPPEGAGGDTLFSNTRLALAGLPTDVRVRIEELTIRHQARQDPEHPLADHPVAFTHPDTGQRVLFMSGRHIDRVLGVPTEESDELIALFAAQIEKPEYVYRHVWRPHDLVVWDNITLQHARTDFDPQYRRHIRRLQIA